MKPAPLRIGISACLLGEKVRYDGGHKRDSVVMDQLAPLMTFVPVCPEVEVGMGVPREPIRLEQGKGGIRLVGIESRIDHTQSMTRHAEHRAAMLEALDLSGYILKARSPSCGPAGVPVKGASRKGRGVFAQGLMARLPLLPVEDEGRLNDPAVRRNFLARVRAYRRLRDFFKGRWTRAGLIGFHEGEKLLLRAHDPVGATDLDRLVKRARVIPRLKLLAQYQERYMALVASPPGKGIPRPRQDRTPPRTRGLKRG